MTEEKQKLDPKYAFAQVMKPIIWTATSNSNGLIDWSFPPAFCGVCSTQVWQCAVAWPAGHTAPLCGNTDSRMKKRKKGTEIERHRQWVILTCWQRSYRCVPLPQYSVIPHADKQDVDLLNGLDRDFLSCRMELTLFYLRAISVRALYAKRQSTSVDLAFAKKASPQPIQCVPDHCWIIEENVVGQAHVTTEKVALNPR